MNGDSEKARDIEFTFMMPCLNEERSLRFCIDDAKSAIERLSLSAEILIVDNGSTDSSADIARECGARVVREEKRGYGAALIKGIESAGGKYVIMGDADGSYDIKNPDEFINKLREGYSLVVGNRFKGGIERGAMPFLHKIGVPALSLLARLRFRVPIYDFHCGLRALKREDAMTLSLSSDGMELATEMIAAFGRGGFKMIEVPTRLFKDKRGGIHSHLRTVRDGFRHLYYIIFEKTL